MPGRWVLCTLSLSPYGHLADSARATDCYPIHICLLVILVCLIGGMALAEYVH